MNKGAYKKCPSVKHLTDLNFSVLQYPRGSDPDFSQLDPWQFTLSGKKIEPLLPLRIDLEKIFAINKYDPEPERSKERRRAVAMYKVSIIPALK